MRRLFGLAFALLALLIVGCGPETVKVRVPPKEYSSIVSLSPGTTEIVFLQFGAARLKGRTSQCDYPTAVTSVPVVMSGPKPDMEKLTALQPDLIVYDPVLFNAEDVASLKKLGCDLFALKAHSLDEFCKSLAELGGKAKAETEVSEYIDKIQQARAAAAGMAKNPRPKVAVLMPGKGAEHYIAGTESFQADLVRASGGDVVGPKADRMVTLNVESLVQMNPDVIVVAGEAGSVVSDARLQSIKAIKDGKVLPVKPEMILRAGSRVDTLINALAKNL